MKKLDWYILQKVLSTFVFVVFMLVLIICVIDFTEKNDDFMQNDVSREQIFKYYLTLFPYFAILLTPITAFIATVFVTAKLAAQTEIIAILGLRGEFQENAGALFHGGCPHCCYELCVHGLCHSKC